MGRSTTVDLDRFAVGIETLIGDIPEKCDERLNKAVEQSTRKTAKRLRNGDFGKSGMHPWSEEYMGGFKSRVEKGVMSVGEVGNSAKPGLVHLLEKGHVTMTGRRTQAFPHMDPAFSAMQDDFMERAEKALGEVLR